MKKQIVITGAILLVFISSSLCATRTLFDTLFYPSFSLLSSAYSPTTRIEFPGVFCDTGIIVSIGKKEGRSAAPGINSPFGLLYGSFEKAISEKRWGVYLGDLYYGRFANHRISNSSSSISTDNDSTLLGHGSASFWFNSGKPLFYNCFSLTLNGTYQNDMEENSIYYLDRSYASNDNSFIYSAKTKNISGTIHSTYTLSPITFFKLRYTLSVKFIESLKPESNRNYPNFYPYKDTTFQNTGEITFLSLIPQKSQALLISVGAGISRDHCDSSYSTYSNGWVSSVSISPIVSNANRFSDQFDLYCAASFSGKKNLWNKLSLWYAATGRLKESFFSQQYSPVALSDLGSVFQLSNSSLELGIALPLMLQWQPTNKLNLGLNWTPSISSRHYEMPNGNFTDNSRTDLFAGSLFITFCPTNQFTISLIPQINPTVSASGIEFIYLF